MKYVYRKGLFALLSILDFVGHAELMDSDSLTGKQFNIKCGKKFRKMTTLTTFKCHV
jgi:hypothetical protein